MMATALLAALPRLAKGAAFLAISAFFYVAGQRAAELHCINERMRMQHEAQTAIAEASAKAQATAADLEESRYQIEVMHDQHEDEIAAALDRNRDLLQRVRQQPARADRCAIPRHTAPARRADAATAAAGLVSAGIQPLPAEFAAECDRVLSMARAGQDWAKSIDNIRSRP